MMAERRFRLTDDERAAWQRDGYIVREDVFTGEENEPPQPGRGAGGGG